MTDAFPSKLPFSQILFIDEIFSETGDLFSVFIAVVLVKFDGIIHFLTHYESEVNGFELFAYLTAVGDDFGDVYE